MQDQLLALQQRLQKTIVFITHDIEEALRLGQHIVILRDGKVEQVGTPDDIRNHPANEYVERFVVRRGRSEEHTSELQSLMRNSYAVFCLKKKKTINYKLYIIDHK